MFYSTSSCYNILKNTTDDEGLIFLFLFRNIFVCVFIKIQQHQNLSKFYIQNYYVSINVFNNLQQTNHKRAS